MEILAAPRGTGKTTKLVAELLDNPASVIVVSTTQRKQSIRPIVELVMRRRSLLDIERDDQQRIVKQPSPAQRIDEVMERVVTCDDVRRGDISGVRRGLPRRVLVDDLEDVLFFFLGADVSTATVSVR